MYIANTNAAATKSLRYRHAYASLLTAVCCLCTALVMLVSCSDEHKWRIGVSQCSDDDWRNKMNEEILREALLMGDSIEIEIRSAADNNDKQIADLRYFADNGFDLIAVAPNQADALTPIIKQIFDAGTPVVIFDRTVNGDSYTAYQGADNEAIGQQAAHLAYAYSGEGAKILEIEGLPGSTPAILRKHGFDTAADSLSLNVVASAPAQWNYDDAVRVADSLLNINDDIDVLYAHNDRMAMGAADVLQRRGLRDRIKVIGVDAAPAIGLRAVADGQIDATFVYPTDGQSMVRTAIAILTEQPYERDNILPTPTAVDATNASLLLLQDEALRRETDKIAVLKRRVDAYWERYSIQTAMLYVAAAVVLLLGLVIFLILRAFWSNKRHKAELEVSNQELQKQRDELDTLYHRLEEATKSKLTFFTNVSHDLRTPLTLIADPVHQLAEATNLTQRQHTLMQLADKNVKRLHRLINQILDIRKFDNGHLALNLANIDISAAMREWIAPFAEAAARRHLRFSFDVAPGYDYITAVDVEKVERVLFNLISNAFKFTQANGSVSITLDRQGDVIILKVADTGIGIKAEEINQVFDRFFKTDTDINPNGSGIGLALSKTFVKMHDGDITVDSTPGQGSVFTVSLPVRLIDAPAADVSLATAVAAGDAAELANVEDEEQPVRDDAPTVLVVDDNPDISTLVKSILGESYTVIRARSGAQGIRMASKYIPDLIICDVMMPGIDGYETCRRLKVETVTSHIPVLLLTACSLQQQRTEGYECGADGYMSKPFDSAMLKARCKSLIDNRKRIMQSGEHQHIGTSTPTQATSPRHDIDDEFYARFIQVVEDKLSESDLSVEDIASTLGLSRVQMYRKIKALTNYSPAEILRNTRLERGARLLKTTQCTVSEVAYQVGFTAPGYFTKCYKEYFKESPTDTQNRTSRLQAE